MNVEIIDPYGFVYITTNNINGKRYIGQKKFKRGWKYYFGSGVSLIRAVNKYGKDNFSREIIAVSYNKEDLNRLEISFIKSHNAVNSRDYYNIAFGGEGGNSGKPLSKESRKKMRDARIGKPNPMQGKHHSEETKLKMSEIQKSKIHVGKPHSEETKLKMSKSQKGRITSEVTKQKISNSKTGTSRASPTTETRLKIRESNMKVTQEQVKEIREKYATGKYNKSMLAVEYNVSSRTIGNIINFKNAYKETT